MVDQTLPEVEAVQSENKARKRQKDNYNKAVEAIANLDAEHLEKLAENIDELYESKYGHDKTYKVVLQVSVTDLKKYFFSLKKSVLCVHLAVFRWYIRLSGGQGVDTFSVFGGRLGHFLIFISMLMKTQTARDIDILNIKICGTNIYAQKKKKIVVN